MYKRAEADFLLYCLRRETDGAESSEWFDLDWEVVYHLAVRQGVAPLLSQRLSALKGHHIPDHIEKRLKDEYVQSAARSFILQQEAAGIFSAFAEKGIPVIALKGIDLAERVYDDPALRPMSDLDLMVKKEDLSAAWNLLESLGYQKSRETILQGEHHHLPQMVRGGSFPVEIHWSISRKPLPYQVDSESLWGRARGLDFFGTQPFVFSPEDLLLHLCIHASNHMFDCELRHLFDIRETLRRFIPEFDWKAFVARAWEWEAAKAVYVALRLAEDLTGAAVPDDVMLHLCPEDFRGEFLESARDQIFRDKNELPHGMSEIAEEGSLWRKVRLALRRVFLSPRELAAEYGLIEGSAWVYLYYPVRVFDLLRRNGRIFRQLLRHGRERLVLPDAARIQALRKWLLSAREN